ncbi:unnamed protein product [Parajaminaea phylloscopi]
MYRRGATRCCFSVASAPSIRSLAGPSSHTRAPSIPLSSASSATLPASIPNSRFASSSSSAASNVASEQTDSAPRSTTSSLPAFPQDAFDRSQLQNTPDPFSFNRLSFHEKSPSELLLEQEIEEGDADLEYRSDLDWNSRFPPLYKSETGYTVEDEENPHRFSHLPPPNLWKHTPMGSQRLILRNFQTKARYFMHNKKSIRTFVDRLNLAEIVEQNKGQKVTIVEAYAGAGTLTRELLMRPEVGKVIAMENMYTGSLNALLEDPTVVDSEGTGAKDKLHFIPKESGFHWSVYDQMEEDGLLSHLTKVKDDPSRPAQQLAPLVFVSQLPNTVHGDLFYTQLVAAISNGQWLFKYGRIKLAFIMPQVLAEKSLAKPGDSARARIGTLSEVLCEQDLMLRNEIDLNPQNHHIYPPGLSPTKRYLSQGFIARDHQASGANQKELCAFSLVPKIRQAVAWKRMNGNAEIAAHEEEAVLAEAQRVRRKSQAASLIRLLEEAYDYDVATLKRRSVHPRKVTAAKCEHYLRTRAREMKAEQKRLRELKKPARSKVRPGRPKKKPEVAPAAPAAPTEDEIAYEKLQSQLRQIAAEIEKEEASVRKILRDPEQMESVRKTVERKLERETADFLRRAPQLAKDMKRDLEENKKPVQQVLLTGEDPNGVLPATEELLSTRLSGLRFRRSKPSRGETDESDGALPDGSDPSDQSSSSSSSSPSLPSSPISTPVFVSPGLTGIEYESLDYLLRALYVLRTKSVAESLSRTYPGAQSVLARLTPPGYRQPADAPCLIPAIPEGQRRIPIPGVPEGLYIDPSTRVVDLTDDQWMALARTFEKWPFRPEYLFDEAKFQSPPGLTTSDRKQAGILL